MREFDKLTRSEVKEVAELLYQKTNGNKEVIYCLLDDMRKKKSYTLVVKDNFGVPIYRFKDVYLKGLYWEVGKLFEKKNRFNAKDVIKEVIVA
jgi:neutral trehalase